MKTNNKQCIKIYRSEKGQTPIELTPIDTGKSTVEERMLMHPHRSDRFELLWLKAGTCNLAIDFNEFVIGPGTAHWIKPGQVHKLEFGEGAEGYLLHFDADFLSMQKDNFDLLYNNRLFYTPGTVSVVMFSAEEGDAMEELIHRMRRELQKPMILGAELLRGLLKVFLIELTRCRESSLELTTRSRNLEMVKRFLLLLDKNFATKKMVSDYADEIMVTPNYLNEIVKKITGSRASFHIQQRITLEAKRHAKYELKSMKEVAFMLGFDDLAHFSKFFKRNVGMNFTDFKREADPMLA